MQITACRNRTKENAQRSAKGAVDKTATATAAAAAAAAAIDACHKFVPKCDETTGSGVGNDVVVVVVVGGDGVVAHAKIKGIQAVV